MGRSAARAPAFGSELRAVRLTQMLAPMLDYGVHLEAEQRGCAALPPHL